MLQSITIKSIFIMLFSCIMLNSSAIDQSKQQFKGVVYLARLVCINPAHHFQTVNLKEGYDAECGQIYYESIVELENKDKIYIRQRIKEFKDMGFPLVDEIVTVVYDGSKYRVLSRG